MSLCVHPTPASTRVLLGVLSSLHFIQHCMGAPISTSQGSRGLLEITEVTHQPRMWHFTGPQAESASSCLPLSFLYAPALTCVKETVCMRACSVAQSYLTPFDPIESRPPGSSVHGIFPGKNTRGSCHFLLRGIFPIQESNPRLLHCRGILYHCTTWKARGT